MEKSDYNSLKRFNPEEHFYKFEHYLSNNDILEVYDIHNHKRYMKVRDSYQYLLYDLIECTENGEPVRCPITRNSLLQSKIEERIKENDWRLYKRAEQGWKEIFNSIELSIK